MFGRRKILRIPVRDGREKAERDTEKGFRPKP